MPEQPTKLYTVFSGGASGMWNVVSQTCICGDPLPECMKIDIDPEINFSEHSWVMKGYGSNLRYTNSNELSALKQIQPALGREEAIIATLIPIKKCAAWWELAQDERRKIMEEQSKHITIGMLYLPAIARKLYHCKDTGGEFDFLTWFEFAKENETAFDDLLFKLRKSEEWKYVIRESEFRLARNK